MKKRSLGAIIAGGLSLLLFVGLIIVVAELFGISVYTMPGEQLTSGQTVRIRENSTFLIRTYPVDVTPPAYYRQDFTFTNIATGEQVVSRQNIIYHTDWIVNLVPGNYIIDFEPWDEVVFIWRGNMFINMFQGFDGLTRIRRVIVASVAFTLFLGIALHLRRIGKQGGSA